MPRQEWVGIEPMGEVFLLTFLFIGLVRKCRLHVQMACSQLSLSERLILASLENRQIFGVTPAH
jgi:hypothetical protein